MKFCLLPLVLLVPALAFGQGQGKEKERLDAGRAALVQGMERTLSVEGSLAAGAAAGRTVVDVREPDAFARCRIPGSLSMSLHAVRAHRFLRGKPLLLVGEGYGIERLLKERGRLARSGFRDVLVLRGGLPAWRAAGLPLEGLSLTAGADVEIPPRALYEEKDLANVVIVGLGSAKAKNFKDLPGALVLPAASTPEQVLGVARDLVKTRANVLYVVLAAEPAAAAEPVRAALARALDVPVYAVAGGLPAYRRFLDEQLLAWDRAGKTVVGGCATCR